MITYEVKVYTDGTTWWYLNDKLHRQDGPAIEWANGDKEWWFGGERHRQDGPAVEHTFLDMKKWYLNGERLTENEWRAKVQPSQPSQPSQPNCEGRLIEIDGKTYKLIEVHGE